MKKLLFTFFLMLSFLASSQVSIKNQNFYPIVLDTTNITSIGGSSFVFNTSPTTLGTDIIDLQTVGLVFKANPKITVYPNPTYDFVYLDKNYIIELNDQFKTIMTTKSNVIDLTNLNAGVYYLTIDKKTTIKIIKL